MRQQTIERNSGIERDTGVLDGLTGEDAAAWQQMADHPTATTAFVQACLHHSTPGFRPGIVCHHEDGRLLAGAQMFTYDFRFDMPFSAGFRAFGDWLVRVVPRLIQVPLVSLGSPMSDRCALVVDPSLDADGRQRAISAILDKLVSHAQDTLADIIAVKDVSDALAAEAHDLFLARGFSRVQSLPIAVLDLPFSSQDEYIASLSSKMRADLRRKLRQTNAVVLTEHDSGEDFDEALTRLYAETRSRSHTDYDAFSAVPTSFMLALLRNMKPNARLVVSRVDDEVAGFNLFLTHGKSATAMKIGLSERHVRQHNLYFINWLWMVRHCIANGITRLEMGQTTYGLKHRLGCRLEPSWIYFRHRNRAWNQVCALIGPRISFARMDPDLKKAGW